MTAKTLEQEATAYALDEAKQAQKRHGLTDLATAMYMEGAELGYVQGYTARDKEIEELRALVKELEGMVPKWVDEYSEECRSLKSIGWRGVYVHDSVGVIYRLMVPPIPLPVTK